MKVGTDGVLLGSWVNPANVGNILDIGTGTGLIAIMLAQRTNGIIKAVEIEPHAYKQARENVENCPWKEQIDVIHNSFQDFSQQTNQKFDFIVSNPPFFSNSLKTPVANRNFARHNDTLSTNDLLSGVCKLLSLEGSFCVILPYVDSQIFIVDAALYHLYCNRKTSVKTTSGKKPSRVLMQFSWHRTKMEENEIIIQDKAGNYTVEYRLLTSNYYLFF